MLDRIDQIAAPDVTLDPDDTRCGANELAPANRRRTPAAPVGTGRTR